MVFDLKLSLTIILDPLEKYIMQNYCQFFPESIPGNTQDYLPLKLRDVTSLIASQNINLTTRANEGVIIQHAVRGNFIKKDFAREEFLTTSRPFPIGYSLRQSSKLAGQKPGSVSLSV